MRTRHPVLAASVVALLLAACGGGGGTKAASSKSSTSTSTSSSSSSTTSTTEAGGSGKAFEKTADSIAGLEPTDAVSPKGCKVGSGDADGLEALLPAGPVGFVQQADDVGDTGPSDFDKAVSDDGEDDAAESLTESGFLGGYQRYWVRDDEDDLVAFIYEFCDGAGAQRYLDRSLEIDDDIEGVQPFTPAGVPGARGESGTSEGYTAAQLSVVHGRYLVMAQSGSEVSGDKGEFEVLVTNLTKGIIAKLGAA
jgi:hypothetical protein